MVRPAVGDHGGARRSDGRDDGRADASVELDVAGDVDVTLTVGMHRVGGRDPSVRLADSGVWRATRTPAGPATVVVTTTAHGRAPGPVPRIERTVLGVRAWGPGAAWAVAHAAELVGDHDDPYAFAPPVGLVRDLHHRHLGLRIGRTRALMDLLIPTILEQKVTTIEAHRAYHGLVRAFGEPAPGPAGAWALRLRPDPQRLAGLAYHDLHRFGIERRRAETILRVCRRAERLDSLAAGPITAETGREAQRVLETMPGIGPWTTAILAQQVFGDPDAVIVGDYHLPNIVAFNLAGEARADDARMLELLEPYRGQRGRVVRLLALGGRHAPRRGPGLPIRSFARY